MPVFCKATYTALVPDYFQLPQTIKQWPNIIENTDTRWQFPNCFAAVDGKHVGLICSKHSGSEFYNCKAFYSIVLLSFVDYGYKILRGRIST